MLRYQMAVVTNDNKLKRAVKRVTTATGSKAEFATTAGELDAGAKTDLAIFDARESPPDKAFAERVPSAAKIIYIIPGDSLVDRVTLLADERVTSLFCHDERFDDDEFIASATKGLRQEVFGLQKYFPWGVTTFSMVLKNYEEKGRAIDILMHYAQLAGVRGPVRDRIQLVADELMMNALYHAPVDEQGREIYEGKSLKELASLAHVNPVQLQYGCSGRYFGISVRDGGGSLSRERALQYLLRAKTGAQMETKSTGAGLGLISVLRSVSKLVFNLDPGTSTEVIGLFDMELFARGKVGARSLHLFTEARGASGDGETGGTDPDMAPPRPRTAASGPLALVAALLLIVATAMGTAYYMQRDNNANAEQQAQQTVTVTVEPKTAEITFEGASLQSGVPWLWPKTAPARGELRIIAKGYRAHAESLSRAQVGTDLRVKVYLERE